MMMGGESDPHILEHFSAQQSTSTQKGGWQCSPSIEVAAAMHCYLAGILENSSLFSSQEVVLFLAL